MSENGSYDVILLGSSPLAIAEAVFHRKQGRSTLNIDQREQIGGAWTTIRHEGIPEVEIGCHIWDIDPWAFKFLEQFYELQLTQLKPQPRLVTGNSSIPYDWKQNMIVGKFILKHAIRLKFKDIQIRLKTPAFRIAWKRSKYLYPKKGAFDLYRALEQKVKNKDLNIKLNCSVNSISCSENSVTVEMEDGKTVTSENLVLTSLSSIQKLTFEDGTSLEPKTKQVDYIHVHLLYNQPVRKAFAYERWMKDDTIHRVSDMTFEVEDELTENESLLCVGIHATTYHNSTHEELLQSIHQKLLDRKLVRAEANIVQHGFNVFPSYYNSPEVMLDIEKRSKGKISVLRSTNFTYSFSNQRERYQSLID